MSRSKAYRRKQRKRHINRRLTIANDIIKNHWYAENHKTGYLSKFNLVCSCAVCSAKTKNKGRQRYKVGNYAPTHNYKHSDAMKVVKLNQSLEEYSSSVEEGALLRR